MCFQFWLLENYNRHFFHLFYSYFHFIIAIFTYVFQYIVYITNLFMVVAAEYLHKHLSNFTPRPIILNFEYFYNWSNSYLFSGTLFYQIADFIWFLNQNLSSKSLNKGSGIIAFCIYLQCLYTGSNILRYNCKTRLSKRGYSDKEIDNL